MFLLSLAWAGPALAERIALVRPDANESLLSEVFNRLRGELRMHGFETVFLSEAPVPSLTEFRRISELGQADAVIAFERLEGESACHVWFVDRESARDRVVSIAVPETEEAPTLLALRTVEMLRSGLRERQLPTSVRSPRVSTAARPAAHAGSPIPAAEGATNTGRLTLQLSGGLAWVIAAQPAAVMLMPSIGYRVTGRLELATKVALQWRESRMETLRAQGEVRTDFALLEARWLPTWPLPELGIVPVVGLGAARISALGTVRPDARIQGQSANAWTMALGAGLGAWLNVNARWKLGVVGELGLLLPKPMVRLDDLELTMGRPWIDVCFGASYSIL